MKLGEIYYFVSDEVRGYDTRPKFHLYLCEDCWWSDGKAFLFVNKSDYGNDYKILKKDYDFFTLEESYVDAGEIVFYTDAKLAILKPKLCGQMKTDHLRGIYDAVLNNRRITGRQQKLACEALKAVL